MRSQLESFGSMQEEARQLLHHAMMAALIESSERCCVVVQLLSFVSSGWHPSAVQHWAGLSCFAQY